MSDLSEPETDQPQLLDMGSPAFSTIVAVDGRIVRFAAERDGGITIHVTGRGNPLRIDRFQAMAMRAAFAEPAQVVSA
jgi:hypothetical protein